MNISKGKIAKAQKCCIYGSEGIGKTTFAAQFPEPLFIDTEDGTNHLDVARFDRPTTWDMLLKEVEYVIANPEICKTLVIDTADWAERLAIEYVCAKYKQDGLESFAYGRGYTYLADEFSKLLSALDKVVEKGIHVVVTAHAKMRKFEQPDEMASYDRWELKLTRQVAPLLKEWCDLLLFCNYKTFVVQSGNAMEKAKAQGGKRVMYASHHPCWDAKNRHNLPDEMPLEFESIAHIFTQMKAPTIPEKKPIEQLRELMQEAEISELDLQKVVSTKGHYSEDTPIEGYSDKFINGWIIKYWPQIVEIIKTGKGD